MKTDITLALTKDSYILSDVFGFRIEDLLQYYMQSVSLISFLEANEDDVHPATTFFVMCTT